MIGDLSLGSVAKLNSAQPKAMIAAAAVADAAAHAIHATYLAQTASIVAFHNGRSGLKVAFHSIKTFA